MTNSLTEYRAKQAHQAVQRAEQERRRKKLIDATTAIWWPKGNPTHCIGCSAEVPNNYAPGQELPCGH